MIGREKKNDQGKNDCNLNEMIMRFGRDDDQVIIVESFRFHFNLILIGIV